MVRIGRLPADAVARELPRRALALARETGGTVPAAHAARATVACVGANVHTATRAVPKARRARALALVTGLAAAAGQAATATVERIAAAIDAAQPAG